MPKSRGRLHKVDAYFWLFRLMRAEVDHAAQHFFSGSQITKGEHLSDRHFYGPGGLDRHCSCILQRHTGEVLPHSHFSQSKAFASGEVPSKLNMSIAPRCA